MRNYQFHSTLPVGTIATQQGGLRGKEGTIATLQAGGSIASHQVEGGASIDCLHMRQIFNACSSTGNEAKVPVSSLQVVQKSCMHGIEFVSWFTQIKVVSVGAVHCHYYWQCFNRIDIFLLASAYFGSLDSRWSRSRLNSASLYVSITMSISFPLSVSPMSIHSLSCGLNR